MSHYDTTKARIFQWIGIIAILCLFGGAYWYFKVYGSTLTQSQNGIITNGLVGFWSFNTSDINGTTAYDRSGSGNDGVLTGTPTAVDGEMEQALDFNSTADYVDIPTVTRTGAFTYSLWYKTADNNQTGMFLGGTTPGLTIKYGLVGGNYFIRVSGVTGTSDNTVAAAATGAWHHFVVTRDASDKIDLYIDGGAATRLFSNAAQSGSTDVTYLGSSASDVQYFNGQVDEVRLYNRTLSTDEIATLYKQRGAGKKNSSISQPQGTGRLDSGLALYWPLDDGTSGATPTTAADSSTNGFTGTLTNGPTWTTGQIGNAVDFASGIPNDYITVADSGILDVTDSTNFTLSGWFNRSAFTTDTTIVAKSNGQAASDTGYNVYIDDSTDKVTVVGNDGTDQYKMESVSTFTATGWHQFVLVWNDASSSETKLYINGVAEAVTTTGTFTSVNSMANALAFRAGAESDNGNGFSGKLDEIRMYGRTLSSDEVTRLYRLTSPTGVDTGLKGYWSFNAQDMSGTTAYDQSGGGTTGTLTGPVITEGKVGQGLFFDGTDDYVATTTQPAATGEASLFTWMKATSVSTQQGIVGDMTGGDTPGMYALYLGTTAGKVNATWNGSFSNFCPGNQTLTAGLWYHVGFVRTGSSGNWTCKMYVNGVLDNTTTGITYNPASTLNFTIGKTGTREFGGSLDEVRVYNRALSDAEVKGLYDVGESDKVNTSVSQAQGTGRLDSGLAGYWKLDDGSGTSAIDASTNGSTGTLTGGPTWTTGQIGSAVDFDGTDDYITMGDNDLYGPSTDFTIAAWINQDTITTFQCIFCKDTRQVGAEQFRFSVGESVNGKLYYATGVESVGGSTLLTAGTWYHAVITKSSATGLLTLYLNGVSDGSAAVGSAPSSNTSNAKIGSRDNANASEYWNGKIDEVRFYNRGLSAEEVVQLYRLTSPTGTETGLKGYWSFNGKDMSGTTAYDRSGAGNTGTLTGGAAITEGKAGQALSFDGTDDYVDMGNATNLQIATGTVSAWIKTSNAGASYRAVAIKGDAYGFFLKDNVLMAYDWGGGNVDRSTGVNLADGVWHHVVEVFQSGVASGTTFYVDGALVSTTTMTVAFQTTRLAIGNNYGQSQYFNGRIDEPRVYNRALTAAEIASLYNQSR